MNQAPSPRLRPQSLLLLVPLLLAMTPPPPTRFEVNGVPERLGQQIVFNITVIARYDSGEIATEYTGTVHFITQTPGVTPPPDTPFTLADQGARQFTVTFPATGPFDLKAVDTQNSTIVGHLQSTLPIPGPPERFVMDVPENVTAGAPVDFTVTPLDNDGNTTTFQGQVHFETDVLKVELPPDTPPDGRLPPQFRVTFFSASSDALKFTVTGKEYLTGRTLSGESKVVVHPASLSQVELTAAPANPVPACGKVALTLTPKDPWTNTVRDTLIDGVTLCKTSGSSATFEGTSLKNPSYAGDCVTGTLEDSAQVFWRDPKGETVDFAVTSPDSSGPVRVSWQPCPSAFLQLQLRSLVENQDVQPGGTVELEAKVSYSGEEPITDGMLMMLGDGLTVLSVSLDGELLSARGDGFVVPMLRKDASVTAKITAQAALEPNKTLTMKTWFASADGLELTPKQSVTLDAGEAGVDVGCGCHAGALPGQLFPWLALLLAASRPWERLRRLRRGERTDH